MPSSHTARTASPRIRLTLSLAAVAVVGGVALGIASAFAGLSYPASARATTAEPSTAAPSAEALAPAPPLAPPDGHSVAVSTADGAVGAATTVFDDHTPAVGNLGPELRDALRTAATAAAADGVTFSVNSGWRSPRYQEQLLSDAVSRYGSVDEAARWVATPTTSLHVRGEAIDMGTDAAAWLSAHGAAYGLCQIYENEPWHYELRADAVSAGCPEMFADPTHDPRMR